MAIEETKTNEEKLAEVNAAISAVLAGGQSYTIGSRSLTRADLANLRTMRDELEAVISGSKGNKLFDRTCVAVFEGR